MNFGRMGRGFGRMGLTGGRNLSWLPLADGITPTLYANFATEDTSKDYYYNGAPHDGAAAWLAALGGTFTGSANGTRVNSAGLITQAVSNTLRFDHDPVTLAAKGILLEGARTNLFTQSSAFDHADWEKQGARVGITANSIASPDGTTNADTLSNVSTGANYYYLNQNPTLTLNNTYTFSIYVKANTGSGWVWLLGEAETDKFAYFDIGAGAVGTSTGFASTSIRSAGNGWYRISATFAKTSATAAEQIGIGLTTANGTENPNLGAANAQEVYIYGAQCELGSFASSYIPTTTAAVTRAADSLTWPLAASPTLATLFAKVQTVNVATVQRVVQLDDASADNRLTLNVNASAAAALDVLDGGVAQVAATTGTFTANTAASVAAGIQANDFALVKSGGAAAADVSGTVPAGLTTFRLGADSAGANNLFGNFAQVGYWSATNATDAELQRITA